MSSPFALRAKAILVGLIMALPLAPQEADAQASHQRVWISSGAGYSARYTLETARGSSWAQEAQRTLNVTASASYQIPYNNRARIVAEYHTGTRWRPLCTVDVIFLHSNGLWASRDVRFMGTTIHPRCDLS